MCSMHGRSLPADSLTSHERCQALETVIPLALTLSCTHPPHQEQAHCCTSCQGSERTGQRDARLRPPVWARRGDGGVAGAGQAESGPAPRGFFSSLFLQCGRRRSWGTILGLLLFFLPWTQTRCLGSVGGLDRRHESYQEGGLPLPAMPVHCHEGGAWERLPAPSADWRQKAQLSSSLLAGISRAPGTVPSKVGSASRPTRAGSAHD